MPLVRPRSRPHCVRWETGNPAPPKKGAQLPQFLAHVYCCQTAGWIKMPLGAKVGVGPGDNVLDGTSSRPQKKGAQRRPQFSAMSVVAKWLD